MILISVLVIKQLNEFCTAPLKLPPVISGAKPVFVALVTRHGARTPQNVYLPIDERGRWYCPGTNANTDFENIIDARENFDLPDYSKIFQIDYLPNCSAGQLIVQGSQQLFDLGLLYKDYLFNTLHLFRNQPNSSEIYIQTSDYERTFQSARYFIEGAFGKNKYLINRGNVSAEVLRPTGLFCKGLANVTRTVLSNAEYLKYGKEMWKRLDHIISKTGGKFSLTKLCNIADWISSFSCGAENVPPFISKEDIDISNDIVARYLYTLYGGNPEMFVSYTLRSILRPVINSITNHSNVRFAYFSGHDATIASILTYLGYENKTRIPPYASHLLLELVDINGSVTARWSINGEIVDLGKFGYKDTIPFDKFLSKTKNIYDLCLEMP